MLAVMVVVSNDVSLPPLITDVFISPEENNQVYLIKNNYRTFWNIVVNWSFM